MKSLLYIMIIGILGVSLIGCNEEYEFDIASNLDGNKHDRDSVTIDTVNGIDVSMYPQAAIFPGLVDTVHEAHIDTLINIDLSQKYRSGSEMGLFTGMNTTGGNLPIPVYSTGLYAGAGELVTVNVLGDTWGLSLQVGQHTENLSSESVRMREPIVYTRVALYPGENRIRFPLGGYIWIIRENEAIGSENAAFEFKNVYSTPDYVIDETDPGLWAAKLNSTTVPWMELRSKRMAVSIDVAHMKEQLTDPTFPSKLNEMLHAWDSLIEYYYQTLGWGENADITYPEFPERYIFDVQLKSSQLIHNDGTQGITMVKNQKFYDQFISLTKAKTAEFGEMYNALIDKYILRSNTFYEWNSTLGLIPLYRIAESYYKSDSNVPFTNIEDLAQTIPSAIDYAAVDSAKNNLYDIWNIFPETSSAAKELLPLVQLEKYAVSKGASDGWKYIHELQSDTKNSGRRSNFDEMAKRISEYFKTDFTPFFDHWGYALGDNTRAYMNTYEPLDIQIWKINPLDRNNPLANASKFDSSKYPVRHNRSRWTITAVDGSYTENNEDYDYDDDWRKHFASYLLDGDISTYWHSYTTAYNGDKNKRLSSRSLPYYIIIDMGEQVDIDGIFFSNGRTDRFMTTSFNVQYTNSCGDELNDPNAIWSDLCSVNQNVNEIKYNLNFKDIPATVSARYLRIVISEINTLTPDPTNDTDVEEFNNLKKSLRHCLAEFGTFKYVK